MTQKNGTIEFILEEGQSPCVYNKDKKKLIRFNKMSKKYFTSDPFEIQKLDSLGYKRGKVKVDGVAVLASEMTEDEKKRAQRSLEIKSEKAKTETPKVEIEVKEGESPKNEKDSSSDKKVVEEVNKVVEEKKEVENKKEVKKDIKKSNKKPASSKLEK